uniref:Uncharacterized protein n=1 Tax=Tanacetum cinerariifolium TaxID=118510 RepID=A0A6L2NMD4_TANCI|nr:hypothetical protein [Tanacetum cinerariifolium]
MVGRIPGVPDESTVISAISSEATGTKPGVPDEEKKKDDADNDKSIGLEMTVDEETNDKFVHGKEQVNNNEDEEMTYSKVEESRKGDAKISDVAKADVEKIEKIKDDAKKAKLPPTSSSLSVSLGFDDQFIKLSSDTSLVSTVKDTTDAKINSLLDIKIQSKVPYIQSPFVLVVPILVIYEPSVLTPILKTPSVAHATTLLTPLSVSTIPPPAPKSSKIQKLTIDLKQESEKSALEIRKIKREKAKKQKMPKYNIKSTDKTELKEYDQKSALYQTMHESKSFNKNHDNHALYHAFIEALIANENAIDKGVADTVKNHKRQHDDGDDEKYPLIRPNQGKKTKIRRTKESESSKKSSTTKETSKGKASSKSSKTGHLTVAVDYFFNNDLGFLKSFDHVKNYITSITKTKAGRYEIAGIKDMVPALWSTIKHAYDKDDEKDQALGRKAVSVKKLHGYGHLDEIMVKRADRELYKFKEGDFMDLHLNGTKDMLLLAVQHKLFHLNDSEIVDFIVALRYNKEMSMRKWTATDKRRSELMVELIEKQMRERRIIQNLKRLFGARELKMDYKLMTRTV